MEYFILEVDKEYNPPNLKDWYGRLDKNTLSGKKHYQLPKRMVFSANEDMQTVFTDVIMHPCFMVSGDMKKVISLYEPFVRFTRIILFGTRSGGGKGYHIPFLEEVDCLGEGSRFNLDKSIIHHAQIDGNRLGDRAIVRVAGVNRICILAREDFVESLLCRQMVGLGLQETEIVY